MNRRLLIVDRLHRSRSATAATVAVGALLLSMAVPSLLSALGTFSGPVGCDSNVDFSDDLTDDFTDDFPVEPVGEGSNPCVYIPDSPSAGGDDGGGVDQSDVDADGVVSATPTFTG